MNRVLIGILALLAGVSAQAQNLPASMRAETAKLVFHLATPRAMASLELELNAALTQLRKANGAARLVKLRIFVAAGTDGGMIGGLTAANFKEAHELLPLLNIIQVGALEGGARVLIESTAEAKTDANPNGLAFISGQLTQTPKGGGGLLASVAPLAEKSIAAIQAALMANSLESTDVIRVDCFTSSLADRARVRTLVATAFPRAGVGLMQLERSAANNEVECESIARLKTKPAEPLVLINPTGAQFAQMALVSAPQVVFTSTVAGGSDDAGIRQMFTSLKSILEKAGSSLARVAYTSGYPANPAMVQKFRDLRWEFLDKAHAPASTNLVFEGVLPAGSGAGIDVIALPN
jgi:enamine deaminase RidA (YjgF/YER057c/UK114 family)